PTGSQKSMQAGGYSTRGTTLHPKRMSRTAALVGVFGTVQSKNRVFGLRIGVMHMGKVLPPSTDSQTSISHPVGSLSGSPAFHSILTVCPGWTTCPTVGEISLAA